MQSILTVRSSYHNVGHRTVRGARGTELSVRYQPRQLVTTTEEEDWRPGHLQLQIRRAGGCWQPVQGDPIQVSQYNTLIGSETFLHVKNVGFEFMLIRKTKKHII